MGSEGFQEACGDQGADPLSAGTRDGAVVGEDARLLPALCCRRGGTQGHPGGWRAQAALFQFLLLSGISLQTAE